jgi:ABC-type uncharacterized transport system permease subunit
MTGEYCFRPAIGMQEKKNSRAARIVGSTSSALRFRLSMPLIYPTRLRGWRFLLFNLALGLGHMTVLFSLGSYIALLPHVATSRTGIVTANGSGQVALREVLAARFVIVILMRPLVIAVA